MHLKLLAGDALKFPVRTLLAPHVLRLFIDRVSSFECFGVSRLNSKIRGSDRDAVVHTQLTHPGCRADLRDQQNNLVKFKSKHGEPDQGEHIAAALCTVDAEVEEEGLVVGLGVRAPVTA